MRLFRLIALLCCDVCMCDLVVMPVVVNQRGCARLCESNGCTIGLLCVFVVIVCVHLCVCVVRVFVLSGFVWALLQFCVYVMYVCVCALSAFVVCFLFCVYVCWCAGVWACVL